MTIALLVAPAAASAATTGQAPAAAAHAARSQQRARAADRSQQRLASKLERKSARQAQRSARAAERAQRRTAREAEREERRAAREAERAERSSSRAGYAAAPPAQGEATAPNGEVPASSVGAQTSPTANGDCSLSAEASAHEVSAGEAVTISGKLTCPSGTEASEQEVTVYQRQAGAATSSLTVGGTATTEADGSYHLQSAALDGRTAFVVRAPSARHAARVVVLVTAKLSLQGSAANAASLPMGVGNTPGGPARATFTGALAPGESGRRVALRIRYAGAEWRTVAFTRTDDEGGFTFSHRFRFAGDVGVQAVSHPRGMQRTESPELTYTVVQAQNPALTIYSSATSLTSGDAAAAGEPITITGVAAGSPHRTVTLLSRTSGHFTSLATVQSDEAGAYTFSVDPGQTTVYEVVCGKSHSTQLRIEVQPETGLASQLTTASAPANASPVNGPSPVIEKTS